LASSESERKECDGYKEERKHRETRGEEDSKEIKEIYVVTFYNKSIILWGL
jgi:hypothetical protein